MKKATARRALLVCMLGLTRGPAFAEMNSRFEPLKPLLGKTWRGEFPNSTAQKPMVDVSRFEVALNGQAIRNLHSINDGEYGGETLIVWDKEKEVLVYYYFTTGGFYTTGSMRADGGALVSHEVVKGDAGGVTEVKATSRVLPDGRLHVKTQHLKDGVWINGRDMYYVQDARAVVRFKE